MRRARSTCALAAATIVALATAGPAAAVVTAGSRTAAGTARPATTGRTPRPVTARATPRPAATRGRRHLRVGGVLLSRCPSYGGWCGRIPVPYDYFDPAAGTIRLGFVWLPATGGRAAGTILAVQGGPGYPTSNYVSAYAGIYGRTILRHRNLLLVDLRGTGMSSPFTCRSLQDWTLNDSLAAYIVATGACGRQLNHTRRLIGGRGFVQASDLYTTADAARDVSLLLGRLQTGRVDFYGDSYGTFFGQVLTARYPQLLRSVTLDSAYPVSQKDPFYPDTIRTARVAFDLACERSVACHQAAPGPSWARIGAATRYLRAHPVTGRTRTPASKVIRDTVGVAQLIQLVNLAGSDPGVYRELDPALRALLLHHDSVPLLRLTAQEIVQNATSGPVGQFNDGLYQATTCLDYPQPFGYDASFARRRSEYVRAVARLPRNLFSPFTVHEWVNEPAEEFDSCLRWPRPRRPDPPITTRPPYAPRSLPVLVLSGDLDSLTTPVEGRRTARDMGPSARWILIRNDTHINALDDTFGCASGLVRRFVLHPQRLWHLRAGCAQRTPEVRVVGSFPATLAAVTPALRLPADRADRTGLRMAAVAAAAVGDALWHFYYGDGVHGWGLRGGTCHFTGPARATRVELHGYRWTADTAVNGTVRWNRTAGRILAGRLTVTGPGGVATVSLSYWDYRPHPRATITGSYAGMAIDATIAAP